MLDVEETKEEREEKEEKEEEEEEDVTEKGDQEMIEQMKTMEIMKKETDSITTPSPRTSVDIVNSEITTIEEEGEEATESFENFETTTVIATSISTSEAISYYSSASLPKSDS